MPQPEDAGRFPDQPARRSHRERHLPVGAIQSRDHQCARRAAGRLSQISPAASAHRRLEHESVRDRAERSGRRPACCRCSKTDDLPKDLSLARCGAEHARISRDPTRRWIVRLENGRTIGALDMQWQFYELAAEHLGGHNEETDWLLESWSFTLDALQNKPEIAHRRRRLDHEEMAAGDIHGSGKRRAGTIRGCKASTSSITTSIRQKGLFFGVNAAEAHRRMEQRRAPKRSDAALRRQTLARQAARRPSHVFQKRDQPYVINWDSIACDSRDFLVMGDPFNDLQRRGWPVSFPRAASRRSTNAAFRVDSIESLERRQSVVLL